MTRSFKLFLLGALALVLLYLFHKAMDPAPIPALGAVAGGLLALALRAKWGWLGCATMLGLLGGAGAHACSHIIEGRVESLSQLFQHVAIDAAIGLAVATVVLGITVAADRLILAPRRDRAGNQ